MIEDIISVLEAYQFTPIPTEEPELMFEQSINDLICVITLQPYTLHLFKVFDVDSSKTITRGAVTPAQLTGVLITNIVNPIN